MKPNRKILSVAMAFSCASFLAFQSCTKLANNLLYELPMQTASVNITIPATMADSTVDIDLGSATTNYNVDSFIKASTGNVLGVNNITSAKIKTILLTLQNPDSVNNFSDFKSARASVTSSSNSTPFTVNLENNPDIYTPTLSLPVDTSVDLKSYLNSSSFTYKVGGRMRRSTTTALHCIVQFSYVVKVKG